MNHSAPKTKVYRAIKEKLFGLGYEPGTRIREDLLAKELSTSRTAVREAIDRLVSEGLIQSMPRRGLFVITMTPLEIADLIDVREALESLAVIKCVDVMDTQGLEQLENIIMAAEESLRKRNFKKCNQLDSEFHLKIAEATGNGKLIKFLREIEDFMQIARAMEKKSQAQERVETSLEQHWRIYRAIKSGDAATAAETVARNIQQLRQHLGLISA